MSDLDDIKFELALQEKRHSEIKSLLGSLINSKNDDSLSEKLIEHLNINEKSVALLLAKMSALSIPAPTIEVSPPSVTFNDNSKEVIRAVNESKEQVLKSLETLNGLVQQLIDVRKSPVEMIPEMNGFGVIIKVRVQPVIPKTKYTA